jgi:hypothetical protein
MDANYKRTDNCQEKMKTQVASLASWTDFNQDEMYTMLEACLEKMEVRTETSKEPRKAKIKTDQEEADTTDLEANREKSEAVAEQQDISKEEAAVKTIGALED